MKKAPKRSRIKPRDTMRAEYDFSRGIRGKYAARYRAGTNVVILDPDVAEMFPTSASVNDALRALVKIIRGARPRRPRKSA